MSWKEELWAEWKIEYDIGSGAFGRVYKIKRQDIGGTYYAALKVISFPQNKEDLEILRKKKNMTEDQITTYYQRMAADVAGEFAVMERLKGHTNIVSYEDHKIVPHKLDAGWDVLIRMELLTSLPDYLKEHRMTEKDVCTLGIDICKALTLCEKVGVIHRDIKPENIFVSEYGDFKLGDFSLAKHMSLGSRTSSPQGTYSYMAPEVYKGFAYDSRIDLYSLGLILYRLLNQGRGPFQPLPPTPLSHEMKERANQKRLHSEAFPKPVHASGMMSSIILKACAYNPENRFRDAEAFMKALKRCSSLQPALETKKQGEYYFRKAAGKLQDLMEDPNVCITETGEEEKTGIDCKKIDREKIDHEKIDHEKIDREIIESKKEGKEDGPGKMSQFFYHAGDL